MTGFKKSSAVRKTDGRRTNAGALSRSPSAYHHGDLQDALIAATEDILAAQGAEGFTLREAARRAGVSPGAPAHHFGNASGLLTEVAIRGYNDLERALKNAAPKDNSAKQRLHAQGVAYLRFALRYPGRFRLMFSNSRLLADDERLSVAAKLAYLELKSAVAGIVGNASEDVEIASISAWSTVHGFAMLALDGKFGKAASGKGQAAIIGVLNRVLENIWPLDPLA
jgi:AcrR family transcriptional regulator